MIDLTPQEVLHLAAADCAANWCSGINQNNTGQRCMLGAINVAAGVHSAYYSDLDTPDVDPGPESRVTLRDEALRLVVKEINPHADLTSQSDLAFNVYFFNDANDQETVVQTLRQGANS